MAASDPANPVPASVDDAANPQDPLLDPVAEALAQERRRVARQLHDSVSQSLTGAYFQSQVLIKTLEKSCPEGARQAAELGEMIHRGVTELAAITRDLHKDG